MKINIIFLTIIALSLLQGCTEKIDVKLDETYDRLVVEGYVTDEPGIHTVELSRSTDYFDPNQAERISDAVVILDDEVNPPDTLEEHPNRAGIYQTDPGYAGVPGREYSLHIELEEAIHESKTYSATCKMPAKRMLDSIQVHYLERWEAWEVRSFATDPPTKDYYMFDLYKNDLLVTDTIDEPFVIDDRLFNGQSTNGAAIGYFQAEYPDEVLKIGDTVKARLASITKAHYQFMLDVSIESGYQNPLFSGPPANIRGNIDNDGIGFFGAYSVDYATTVYTGDSDK